MPEHDAARALRLAEEVHLVTGKILQELDATSVYTRRSRLIAFIGAGLAIVALVLGAGFTYTLYEIHQSQLHACGLANGQRAAQLSVWDEVILLSSAPPPGETPAQRAARVRKTARFRVYLKHQFRQVDCGKLYPGYLPN